MSYCYGLCEYLEEKKHKCNLSGERLTYLKTPQFIAHEHRGRCEVEEAQYKRCEGCDAKNVFGQCEKSPLKESITAITDDKCYRLSTPNEA